ncbi:MAG TPA: aldose epimerase family protein [Bacteroidales bacterium]|nr:aldose epimerase family protein [Bacteroidales bacterium]
MRIDEKKFGNLPGGEEVKLFTLSNENGMEVDITNYGGIIRSIRIPDKNRNQGDVVLGFDSLDEYLGEHPYFGAIIGRYANRIKHGRFTLEGKTYEMVQNNADNHLHGGTVGFDKVLWTAATEKTLDSVTLKLGHASADMHEGYPGNLMVEVDYTLNDQNALIIEYTAKTDKTTHINLTNHSYFNLNNCQGTIHDHHLMIDADQITELDEHSVPTGRILDVAGTCFDFREPKTIGQDIDDTPPGYDHNFVVNQYDGDLRRIATLHHESTGRTMEVLTTKPGVQLYTSNYVEYIRGKQNIEYNKQSAVCLETQFFPDTPNQQTFPSSVLKPEELYQQTTIYRFKW